jgi:hypothetical protein
MATVAISLPEKTNARSHGSNGPFKEGLCRRNDWLSNHRSLPTVASSVSIATAGDKTPEQCSFRSAMIVDQPGTQCQRQVICTRRIVIETMLPRRPIGVAIAASNATASTVHAATPSPNAILQHMLPHADVMLVLAASPTRPLLSYCCSTFSA